MCAMCPESSNQSKVYFRKLENPFLSKTCRIRPGEELFLVYADEDRGPKNGEIVFMDFGRKGYGCGSIDAGVYRDEEDGCFSVTHDDIGGNAVNRKGGTYYPRGRIYLMRIVAVRRLSGQVEWLAGDEKRFGHLNPIPL